MTKLNFDKNLGKRIHLLRLAAHISPASMADRLNVPVSDVFLYEKGLLSLSAMQLGRVSQILKVSPVILLECGAGLPSTLDEVLMRCVRRLGLMGQLLDLARKQNAELKRQSL